MDGPRISKSTGGIMIACAVFVDLAQFLITLLAAIPLVGIIIVAVINPIISFAASMIFGIWCSHLGMSLMNGKRVLGFLGTLGAEVIPFIDSFPWWTCLIAYTVITEWRRETDI